MSTHGSREWWHTVGVLLVVAVGYAIIVTHRHEGRGQGNWRDRRYNACVSL